MFLLYIHPLLKIAFTLIILFTFNKYLLLTLDQISFLSKLLLIFQAQRSFMEISNINKYFQQSLSKKRCVIIYISISDSKCYGYCWEFIFYSYTLDNNLCVQSISKIIKQCNSVSFIAGLFCFFSTCAFSLMFQFSHIIYYTLSFKIFFYVIKLLVGWMPIAHSEC